MKKKMVANIVMVAVILVIAAAGILTAGNIQGWFDVDDGGFAVLTQLRGIVTMERDGVAYPADSETVLRQGDKITCSSGATATIQTADGYFVLANNAEIEITNPASESFTAKVSAGEIFAKAVTTTKLIFDGREVELTDTVVLLSVRSGSQTLSVFAGNVEDAQSGQVLNWVNGERSVDALAIQSLNDFAIEQLRTANESMFLCFSNADLDALTQKREEEMQAMLNATEMTEPEEATEPTEPETVVTEPTEAATEATPRPTQPTEKETEAARPPEKETEPIDPPTEGPTEAPTAAPTEAPTEPKNTCTITIRCDTILSNMDNLDPAKAGFVPDSGVILSTKTVEFTEGETVFDVLKRVCSACGIQLEYSWTPMYDSYYIEGINNLYEFDCGSESGWMYKVNGWYPNYGCSGYTLKNGDSIVWCYTCVGLGADLGA